MLDFQCDNIMAQVLKVDKVILNYFTLKIFRIISKKKSSSKKNQRSDVKNPNNRQNKQAKDNRSNQKNPNHKKTNS